MFASDRHADFEVYNDANSMLVNLFRCIKHHPDELRRELRFYINSREMFSDFQAQMNIGGLTDIQRAAMFYVCIKISFGADVRSFGCGGRKITTDSFDGVAKRLERVTVENKDFEKLIKQYDRPGALIYCDPPYHSTERHYAEKFSEADHLRLCGTLKGVKGRFVLSYNDDGFVRNLYKDFEIIEVRRQNNLSSGSFKELIIKNF